ncbi:MAG: YraN family protein [Gammaproteobacteria bacterium]|jgi:putative endonuclease|nr:YraN family protein [Gammaproteobacteria bacterium]MDP6615594.1 YraN family protein [Gammaproteobacteria bacterium]MDP6694732.1 YraN family protein [Gammaproteobacteria bacterium]MDP7041433.1 YraN family protein [Gammaproteobacteria bacterium]
MSAAHLRRGRQAEKVARRWLVRRGLKHIQSNFRCRYGELDLIMRDGSSLVVVEVRYRNTRMYGGAIGSVTRSKILRVGRATELFLRQHTEYRHLALRFDVLAISGTGRARDIDWRRSAFGFDADLPGCD